MTKIIELIFTEERRGTGKESDPIRLCRQLWTKDGLLVAEEDPCSLEEKTKIIFEPRNID